MFSAHDYGIATVCHELDRLAYTAFKIENERIFYQHRRIGIVRIDCYFHENINAVLIVDLDI